MRDGAEYTEPTTVNAKGDRCVVETNWDRREGARCQVVWQMDRDGCLVTTLHPGCPPIRFTLLQCAVVARWLRGFAGDGATPG